MEKLDIMTKAKITTINKRRRRAKREKRENLKERFDQEMKERDERLAALSKEKKVRELLDTIRALQLVGGDTSNQKIMLNEIFKQK